MIGSRKARCSLLVMGSALLAACTAGQGGASETPSTSTVDIENTHGHSFGGGAASMYYEGFAAFAKQFDGIALVEVVAVSEPRWNTPDRGRPSEQQLHAERLPGDPDYFIGRAYTVRLVRMVRGEWTPPSNQAVAWEAGGRVGADEYAVAPLGVTAPTVGQQALALTLDGLVDFGTGVTTPIAWLLPVGATGQVNTLDPTETLSLGEIERLLSRP